MSLIIIDNIKTPAPKWVAPPPKPTFRTTLERQKYWAIERERWVDGYGDGYSHLCGMHYFHLTQGHIKDGSDGSIIRPSYRDVDEWLIEPLHDAFWNLNTHIQLYKRREVGATVLGCGLLPTYTMRMFPSSTFGFTSCDQDRIGKAYYDKTMVYLDEMDLDIKPRKDKSNETKQNTYLRLEWKTKENDEDVLRYSDLFAKETAATDGNSAGFSGTRMRAAYYDEFPLHKRRKKLLGSSTSCFMKGAKQSGLLFAAGTIEDTITPEQIAEIQQLVSDSEYLNFKVVFAPAWWGLMMDENGVSNEKAAVEWVMKEREKLDKLEDKSFLNAFIKNYPLSLDEIFQLGGSACWDEYAAAKINEQSIAVAKKPAIPLYNPKETSINVEMEPSSKGVVKILEHPKENVKYVIGVDGIMTSELTNTNTSASDYAICVMKGIHPENELQFAPVAIYKQRPKSIEDANKIALNILKYYNKHNNCRIIGETNAGGEHLLKMIQNAGLWDKVIYRKDINKKGWVDTKKAWFYRNDDIKDWQYEAANIYFKKYSQMVMFPELLNDAKKGYDENTDILDAFMACLYGWGTGDIFGEKQDKPKRKTTIWMVKYVNGKPEWTEKTY